MGEAPLSLHLEADVMKELEREARLRDVSESEVARQVIEAFFGAQTVKRQAIAVAIAEADKGVFISSEAMLDWMERLETDPDAVAPEPDIFPPPKA